MKQTCVMDADLCCGKKLCVNVAGSKHTLLKSVNACRHTLLVVLLQKKDNETCPISTACFLCEL